MKDITILLVEDDLTLKKAMVYTLKREGFIVIEANCLEEARNKYNENKIQLVLLDITLPDGNGYDLCGEIREKSEIPIIFITALDDEANVVLGLDIGGDDYISKPIRIRELISRINAVLRRKGITSREEENIIINKNLKVDLLKCTVYKNNEIINLTTIEYKLLLILMENNGIVLTRDKILQKLWDVNGEFVDDNTLSVYIKRLRDKLSDENNKYIHTVRGIGYKWGD